MVVKVMLSRHSKVDIDRFLAATGANKPCPACGKAEWQYVDDEDGFLPTCIPITMGMEDGLKNFISTIMIGCGNCGYCRQHGYHFIRLWLAENPA